MFLALKLARDTLLLARPTSVVESDGPPAFSTESNDGGQPGESTLPGTPAKAKVRSASPKRKTKAKSKKAPSEPREPSLPRTEIFLSKIQAEGLEPTTQDLERFRPAWIPDPLAQFDEYKVVYNDTVADLDRSFNREQLSSFVNSVLSFIPNKTARKRELINIMLAKGWGMPSPVQLEKERREQTEIKKQGNRILTPLRVFGSRCLIYACCNSVCGLRGAAFRVTRRR